MAFLASGEIEEVILCTTADFRGGAIIYQKPVYDFLHRRFGCNIIGDLHLERILMVTSIKSSCAIALSFLLIQNAWAVCLNGHPSVAKEYKQSFAVFVGEVSSERSEAPSNGFLDGTSYVVRVREVFRGKPSRTLSLFSENGSGRFPMKVNEAYLLFVYQQSGRMMVDNCGNSKLLSSATKDLAAIKKLK